MRSICTICRDALVAVFTLGFLMSISLAHAQDNPWSGV